MKQNIKINKVSYPTLNPPICNHNTTKTARQPSVSIAEKKTIEIPILNFLRITSDNESVWIV